MCQSEYEGKQKYNLSCIAQGTGQSIRRHRVKQKGSVGRTVDIELEKKGQHASMVGEWTC